MKYLLTIILFVSANIFGEESGIGEYVNLSIGNDYITGCTLSGFMARNKTERDLFKCANYLLSKTDEEWEVFQVEHYGDKKINTIWLRKIR